MAQVFGIDIQGARELSRDLERFATKAVPYATREFVNSAAFEARTLYQGRAEANMVLRSQWTKKSIRVDKTKSLKIDEQEAHIGSVEPYMAEQEDGAVEGAKGKGVPLPAAAPGNRRKRKKGVGSKNRMGAIALVKARVSGNRQRRNAVAIQMALKQGGGYVYLDLRKSRGLYRVTTAGGRDDSGRYTKGTARKARVKKIWDLSKRSVRIPRNPMLKEALILLEPKLVPLAEKALLYQLKRHKILGY